MTTQRNDSFSAGVPVAKATRTTYRFLVEIESESPWVAADIDGAINLAHHDEIERHDIEVKVFHVTLHAEKRGFSAEGTEDSTSAHDRDQTGRLAA